MKSKFFGNRFLNADAQGQPGAGASTLKAGSEKPERKLENNFTPGATNAPVEQIKPVERDVMCTITHVSDIIEKDGKTFHLLSITLDNGSRERLAISPEQWYQNKKLLKAGNDVVISVEKTIEGKTGYMDKDVDEWKLHNSSRDRFLRVTEQTMVEKLAKHADSPALLNALAKVYAATAAIGRNDD